MCAYRVIDTYDEVNLIKTNISIIIVPMYDMLNY